MTRVPSLLIATVSDRLTRARSCESPVAVVVASSEGNMTANELSTWGPISLGREELGGKTRPTTVVAEMLYDPDSIDLHDVCHDITAIVPNAACHNALDYASTVQSCTIDDRLDRCLGKMFEQADHPML